MMKTKFLGAFLCLISMVAKAEEKELTDYAEPAFRSPVVAVEFTGQRCRYCPNMSRGLLDLQQQYGKDNYIVAALHHLPEYSALPSQHVSLYQAEADAYAVSMDIPVGLPHVYYNSLGSEVDSTPLKDMFTQPDLLECTGEVTLDADRQYHIQLKTRLRSDRQEFMQGKQVDVLFWALESGIVALQDDNGKWTYPEHQHVFRSSVNGTWGEPYEIGTTYDQSWPIPASVSVLENTEVIVFFLDHDKKTILDASRLKMSFGDVTGIQSAAPMEAKGTPVFDLSGRQVNAMPKRGIYIQNGKKHIIR